MKPCTIHGGCFGDRAECDGDIGYEIAAPDHGYDPECDCKDCSRDRANAMVGHYSERWENA